MNLLKAAFAFTATLFALAATLIASHAQADTLLTFEDPQFTAMSNSPGSAVPVSAQLSNQYLAVNGALFASGAGYVAIVDHDPVFTPSPPNVIGGTNANGTLNYDAPIFVSFFLPSSTSTLAITNSVKVLGDLIPLGSGSATLTAFDAFGNVIGTNTQPDTGPIGTGLTLSITTSGIHSVEITETNDTIGFDNFQFGPLSAVPTSAVPEPSTWAMILLGFAGLGFMAYRRNSGPALMAA
jgi:hypothetical protein